MSQICSSYDLRVDERTLDVVWDTFLQKRGFNGDEEWALYFRALIPLASHTAHITKGRVSPYSYIALHPINTKNTWKREDPKMPSKQPRQLNVNAHALSRLTILLIFLIVLAAVVAAAFTLNRLLSSRIIQGSGNLITKNMDFSDFTEVDVGGGFKAEITQSTSYSVRITADNNTFDYIDVYKTNDVLTVGLKSGYIYGNITLKTQITMPSLNAVTLSGGTQCKANEFTPTQEFSLTLSGGSSFELEGIASSLNLVATGGSRSDLSDFQVRNATVLLSGGSQATINLNGTLDADLSGGSQLEYIGTPTMGNISTSGGSTITRKQ